MPLLMRYDLVLFYLLTFFFLSHKNAGHQELCRSTKYMMLHVRDCPGTTATFDVCPFPWCRKVKHLLYHLVTCSDTNTCMLCSSLQLSRNMRHLHGLNRHRGEKYHAAIVARAKDAPKPVMTENKKTTDGGVSPTLSSDSNVQPVATSNAILHADTTASTSPDKIVAISDDEGKTEGTQVVASFVQIGDQISPVDAAMVEFSLSPDATENEISSTGIECSCDEVGPAKIFCSTKDGEASLPITNGYEATAVGDKASLTATMETEESSYVTTKTVNVHTATSATNPVTDNEVPSKSLAESDVF